MSGKPVPYLDARTLQSKPPVESFFDNEQAVALWPPSITMRPDFRTQTKAQQTLLLSVQTIFANLPIGTTLTAGLTAGLVTEVTMIDLLDQLSQYLNSDRAYQRIILYLPFELTSPIITGSAALKEASLRFQKTYRTAWEAQSRQYDVRANFVDGDVLEIDKRDGDPVRVVKVTHLIPGLIQSGHMTFSEVLSYALKSPDRLFKSGILEALAVMRSTGLVTENDLERLLQTHDPQLERGYHQLPQRTQTSPPICAIPTDQVEDALRQAINQALRLENNSVTPNRLRWLRNRARTREITATAKRLSCSLHQGIALPSPGMLSNDTMETYVEAIHLLLLQKNQLGKKYRDWLIAVAGTEERTDTVHDAIAKLYRHAYTMGILGEKAAKTHRVIIPALAGPFSKNLGSFAPSVTEFQGMVAQIANDAYLSHRVYPAAILFGSQLKGYGAENSDADVAVFIKPGTPDGAQTEIAARLKHIFAHERIGGSAVMFWLEVKDKHLVVSRNTQTTDAPPLYTWTHVLMGGAWVGDASCITTLHHELLVPYLSNPTTTLDGKPLRERWLEEMERDSIQYRLLHKGFERYYPICNPFGIAVTSATEGTSAFYDGTFRRIATELFLTRVFLPKLDL